MVVETAAVRRLFRSSLGSQWAPAIIATFGTGHARIAVRVIAPHGAAAYRTELAADLVARKASGAGLLQTPQITVSATARRQLASGQVDSRLVVLIANLASYHPVDIVQFGNSGPGASSDVPLRFADIAADVAAAHLASSAYARSVITHLSSQAVQYRPSGIDLLTLPDGQVVLRVGFAAPSPLGLLGPQGSP